MRLESEISRVQFLSLEDLSRWAACYRTESSAFAGRWAACITHTRFLFQQDANSLSVRKGLSLSGPAREIVPERASLPFKLPRDNILRTHTNVLLEGTLRTELTSGQDLFFKDISPCESPTSSLACMGKISCGMARMTSQHTQNDVAVPTRAS